MKEDFVYREEVRVSGLAYPFQLVIEPLDLPVIYYMTDEIESISKVDLTSIKLITGKKSFRLVTCAGVDLHSSEGDSYKGVEVVKLSYSEMLEVHRYRTADPISKKEYLESGLAAAKMMKPGEVDFGFDGVSRDRYKMIYYLSEEIKKLA